MKATMTKKNRAKRTLAGILAATAMMTAVIPTAAEIVSNSAPATSYSYTIVADASNIKFKGPIADYLAENKDELKNKLLQLAGSKAGELAEQVPVAGGLLKSVVGKLFDKFMTKKPEEQQMTINELNKSIQEYKSQLEAAMGKNTKQIENDILCVSEVQSFYNEFTKFMSMVEDYADSIDDISRSNISEEAKTLKVAKLIGNAEDWTNSASSVFMTYNTSRNLLQKCGLLSEHDIFTAIYDYYAGRSMFSGEAKMQAQRAVEYIRSQYIYAYSILTECLTAQLEVLNTEDTSVFPQNEYTRFSSNVEDITYRMDRLLSDIFGTMEGDAIIEDGEIVGYTNVTLTDNTSIEGSYDKFTKIYDFTFINKQTLDKGGKKLSPNMLIKVWSDGYDGRDIESLTANAGLSEQDFKDLVKHAQEKGLSLFDYLETVGFKFDIPGNVKRDKTYMPIGGGKVEVSDSNNGRKYTSKFSIRYIKPFQASNASPDKVETLKYGTHVREYGDYYHVTTDKWTVDSSLKKASNGAAVIFFRAL